MMTRVAAIMLAVASIAFTSCKKDKGGPNNPDPVGQTKKLSRIEENGQLTASFTYNADGTLKTLYADFGTSTTFEFTYDAQKRISQVTSTDGGLYKYIYENGLLTHVENLIGTEKIAENVIQYENGKIKSNTLFAAEPDGNGNVTYIPTFKTVYVYHGNGAVQKVSTYVMGANGQLELDHDYVYDQYDSKKNPLAVMGDFSQAFLYQPISANNPLTEKWVNADGSIDETTVNEYTYDNAGYPVTVKSTTTSNGTPTVRTSKLFY
jgi:YD repeat-containing protein